MRCLPRRGLYYIKAYFGANPQKMSQMPQTNASNSTIASRYVIPESPLIVASHICLAAVPCCTLACARCGAVSTSVQLPKKMLRWVAVKPS